MDQFIAKKLKLYKENIMPKIAIDSENFTEEQFKNIQDLINKYNEENNDPYIVASKAYARTKTDNEKVSLLIEDAFLHGAYWHKDLLTKEEYTRIIYVLAAAFNNPEYDEEARKGAMQFVFKLCKVFNIDPKEFIS
jgi:hypothetical protein